MLVVGDVGPGSPAAVEALDETFPDAPQPAGPLEAVPTVVVEIHGVVWVPERVHVTNTGVEGVEFHICRLGYYIRDGA